MTERLTIDQARTLGYLKPQDTPGPSKPGKRTACPACTRTNALLTLLRTLLEDGHDMRLEHRFHPSRRWRFDLALLDCRIALEIDGGGWVRGAHHRKAGRDRDNEKDAEAQILGWRVIRASWDHVTNGTALATIRRMTREEHKP